MGFDGYLSLGGVELINAERTQRYVRNMAPWLALPTFENYEGLHLALGDKPYESPLIDGAEWVHTDIVDYADVPGLYTVPAFTASHRFYGLYPLGPFTGIGDSTSTAQITEGILSGGQVGVSRDGTRTIRVHGVLIGEDELAAEAGLSWLRAAIRSTDCTMHDSACGTADLQFLLGPPEVCDIWIKGFAGDSETFGNVTPGNSPLNLQMGNGGNPLEGQLSLVWNVAFYFPRSDGQRIQWGALDDEGSKKVETHGPVTIQRSNYAGNPSFTADATGWAAASATLSQVAAGGVDGGGYGHLAEEAPPVIRFNWVPDPAFVNPSMATSGWRLIGATTGVTATGGPTARQGVLTKGGTDATLGAELSLLGPQDGPIASTISLWVAAHGDPITVIVLDNLGTVVTTQTLAAAGAGRVSIESTIGPNYVLRLTSVAAQISIADLLVEEGATAGTFFSGNDADTSTTDYSWLGTPLLSASRFRNGALTAHTLTLLTPDTAYDTLADSFYLRSDLGAQVTAQIISSDDGSILASLPISVPYAWTRYTLSTILGRNTKIVISGTGTYDIDRVLVESGVTAAGSYFDGSSASVDGYATFWLAGANSSTSRRIWDDRALTASYYPTLDPNVYATLPIDRESTSLHVYLDVIQGVVSNGAIGWGLAAGVDAATQLDPITRRYHDVYAIQGPTVLNRYPLNQGGAAIEVDFLLTAENPFAYGPTANVIDEWEELDNFFYSDPRDVLTNLATNPSAETATTGFTAVPGTTGVAALTSAAPSTTTAFGTKVLKCAWTTASTVAGGGAYYSQTVTPGEVLSLGFGHVKSSIANRLQLVVDWYDGATLLSSTPGPVAAVTAGAINTTFTLANITAPATATIARVKIISVAGTGYANWSIGSYLELDGLIITDGMQLYPWFDGSTPADSEYVYAWTGPADASTSTKTLSPAAVTTLIDPLLPALPASPTVPDVSDIAFPDQYDWHRYLVPIPKQDVSLWSNTVSIITLTSKTVAIRQVRLRFYPNPFGYDPDKVDPLYYCGETIVSYLPPATELTVDGVSQHSYAAITGQESQPADSIMYGTGGYPVSWPEMSCGIDYVMSVDILPTLSTDDLDIGLEVTLRE